MDLFTFDLTLRTDGSQVFIKSISSDGKSKYEEDLETSEALCEVPYKFEIQVFRKDGRAPAQHIHKIIVSQTHSGEILE